MKILIAGGGTGGHFYPGYVIAKELEKKSHTVVFVVKKNDISKEILEKEDIPYVEIDMIAFPRSLNPFKIINFFIKFIKSIYHSIILLKDFKPQKVLGMGSYISFPVIMISKLKKIKTFIHESNAVFGLGNRICAIFADKIFAGMEMKNNPYKNKTIITGTPIREIFFKKINSLEIKKKFNIPENKKVITVFGGSQGARNINEAIYYFILKNKTENLGYLTIHITGKRNYDEIKSKYERYELLDENLILFDYYENMNELYLISDLIVSRSGASTIAELIATKTPAILIPLPSATQNHQYENARFLFEKEAAIIIKDDENLKNNLINKILFLFQQNRLDVMRKSYNRINIPEGNKSLEIIISNILS